MKHRIKHRVRNRVVGVASASALAMGGALALGAPALAATTTVAPGESIQAAIDAARPGDTIRLEPGNYRENLSVTTHSNHLTIKGNGATLTPGSTTTDNMCVEQDQGAAPGICVVGDLSFPEGQEGPPTVTAPAVGLTVTGLTIRGFSSDGIFAFGAKGMTVTRSVLANNGGYGVFALTSTGTTYTHNDAHGNGDAGFYVGDSPHANVTITDNVSTDNAAEGILLRNATFGTVRDNYLAGNCAGLLVLSDGSGIKGGHFTIADNVIRGNNKACAGDPDEGEPPTSGIGLGIVGTEHNVVSHNVIQHNQPGGPTFIHGGLVIVSFAGTFTPDHNTFTSNVILHNNPDITGDGTGTGNTFAHNTCETSTEPGVSCPMS